MWTILAEAVQQQNWKEGFYSYCNGPPVVMERLYLYWATPTKKLPQTGTNFGCFKNNNQKQVWTRNDPTKRHPPHRKIFQLCFTQVIHASGVLDFLWDRTALWVGGLRKVGINLQLRHIGLHVQEYRKYSWTEISGHQILVWSPSLLVWSCFAWFITLCIHNRIETRLTYRNSSDKAKTGKESYFCSVLFLSPN